MIRIALILLALSAPAWAQTLTKPLGNKVVLTTTAITTAVPTNSDLAIDTSAGYDGMGVQCVNGGAGSGTVVLQTSCDGTNYSATAAVFPASGVITTGANAFVRETFPPMCAYRISVTACSTCSITCTAFTVGRK